MTSSPSMLQVTKTLYDDLENLQYTEQVNVLIVSFSSGHLIHILSREIVYHASLL